MQSSGKSRIYFNLLQDSDNRDDHMLFMANTLLLDSAASFPIKISMLITPYITPSPVTTISSTLTHFADAKGDQGKRKKHEK